MDRRNFIKETCGACATIGFGAFFLSTVMESCKTPSLSLYKTNAPNGSVSMPLSSMADTDFKLVRINNYSYDVAVLKQSSGDYVALLLMCTHAGQALTKAGSGFFCPLHGSRFSETGAVLKGPATDPLQHLPVKIEKQTLVIKLDSDYYSS